MAGTDDALAATLATHTVEEGELFKREQPRALLNALKTLVAASVGGAYQRLMVDAAAPAKYAAVLDALHAWVPSAAHGELDRAKGLHVKPDIATLLQMTALMYTKMLYRSSEWAHLRMERPRLETLLRGVFSRLADPRAGYGVRDGTFFRLDALKQDIVMRNLLRTVLHEDCIVVSEATAATTADAGAGAGAVAGAVAAAAAPLPTPPKPLLLEPLPLPTALPLMTPLVARPPMAFAASLEAAPLAAAPLAAPPVPPAPPSVAAPSGIIESDGLPPADELDMSDSASNIEARRPLPTSPPLEPLLEPLRASAPMAAPVSAPALAAVPVAVPVAALTSVPHTARARDAESVVSRTPSRAAPPVPSVPLSAVLAAAAASAAAPPPREDDLRSTRSRAVSTATASKAPHGAPYGASHGASRAETGSKAPSTRVGSGLGGGRSGSGASVASLRSAMSHASQQRIPTVLPLASSGGSGGGVRRIVVPPQHAPDESSRAPRHDDAVSEYSRTSSRHHYRRAVSRSSSRSSGSSRSDSGSSRSGSSRSS